MTGILFKAVKKTWHIATDGHQRKTTAGHGVHVPCMKQFYFPQHKIVMTGAGSGDLIMNWVANLNWIEAGSVEALKPIALTELDNITKAMGGIVGLCAIYHFGFDSDGDPLSHMFQKPKNSNSWSEVPYGEDPARGGSFPPALQSTYVWSKNTNSDVARNMRVLSSNNPAFDIGGGLHHGELKSSSYHCSSRSF